MSDATTENTTTTENKPTKTKTAIKGAKAKPAKAKAAAPKTKTPKAAKPKRERKPKEENLVTFAFRLPKAESEALHKAAGPAAASRTMRALAVAFTQESEAAFKSIVLEAKRLRA